MYSDCWHRSSCTSCTPDMAEMPLTAAVRSPTATYFCATQLPFASDTLHFTAFDAAQCPFAL